MSSAFVGDDPPDRRWLTASPPAFTETNRVEICAKVTEAILTSPEFLSPSDYNSKIKSPLEFAVSAVRASRSSNITVIHSPRNG